MPELKSAAAHNNSPLDADQSDMEGDNVILLGTKSDPIQLDGDRYIRGDLIIAGYYSGIGTLYVDGNIYIPRALRAVDSAFRLGESGAPNAAAALTDNLARQYVQKASKDALGLAADTAIFIGASVQKTNTKFQWTTWGTFDPATKTCSPGVEVKGPGCEDDVRTVVPRESGSNSLLNEDSMMTEDSPPTYEKLNADDVLEWYPDYATDLLIDPEDDIVSYTDCVGNRRYRNYLNDNLVHPKHPPSCKKWQLAPKSAWITATVDPTSTKSSRGSVSLVEANLFANKTIAGRAIKTPWTILGSVVAKDFHYIGRVRYQSSFQRFIRPPDDDCKARILSDDYFLVSYRNWHIIRPACSASDLQPETKLPLDSHHIVYDRRLKFGLPVLTKLGRYFGK